ncbi:MAG: serine/threonine-protein kinase [Planctomycetota bacterium]
MSTKGTLEHDLWLGRQALARGLLSGRQLTEALLLQSKTGLRKPLDQLLSEKGWVPQHALEQLKQELMGQPTQKRRIHVDDQAEARLGKIFLRVLCDALIDQEPFITTYLGRLPKDPEPASLTLIDKAAFRHGLWLDFLEAVRGAQGLKDPNVIEVLSVDSMEGHFGIVARYAKGAITLAALLDRVRRLKLSEALRILREISQGLVALHQAGVVHRDLKATRVVLSPDGSVHLALPGVVFSPEGAEAFGVKSMIFGSPHSIAPECLKGAGPDPKNDIYALGVLGYELVTGVMPFEGATLKDLGHQHQHDAPIPPHSILTALPREVGDLLVWMLSKAPGDRPDAKQVVEAITELEGGIQRTGHTQKFQAFNPDE